MPASRLAFCFTLLLLPLTLPGPSFAQLGVEQLQPPGGVVWDKVDRKQPEAIKIEQLNSIIQEVPKKLTAAMKATVSDLLQGLCEAVFWGCFGGAIIGCVASHVGIHLLRKT